jgi:hypothetical protein
MSLLRFTSDYVTKRKNCEHMYKNPRERNSDLIAYVV